MKTILLILILGCAGTINAQVHPLAPCCDNAQAEGLQADAITGVKDIFHNCADDSITARQCVDRTRDGELCNGGGSRFCKETSSQYPRYYALYHPIVVSTHSMSFSTPTCDGNPSPQSLSITNGVWQAFQIDNTLNWTAGKTQSWLTISPSSGTVSGSTPLSVTISINVAGLGIGTYTDLITVSATQVSNRQWETIQVTLNITSAPSISISGPTSLTCNQAGTWTASVSCGVPPYHYVWYYYKPCNGASPAPPDNIQPLLPPPCGVWLQSGDDSPTFSRSDCSDFEVKCCVNDATNHYATSNIVYVAINGSKSFAAHNPMEDAGFVKAAPKETALGQNYPNPFNPTTEISFALPKDSYVQLAIYDMLGREVARLADEEMNAGYHSVTWNATNVPSGVYICKLSAGDYVQTKRMVVMK